MIAADNKILNGIDIHKKLQEIRLNYENVTMVFGHFNIIHPGHLRFLRHAQEIGDCLIVVVQGDKQLSNVESNQYFTQEERAQGVAALEGIDLVVILDNIPFTEVLEIIRPKHFVLGKEFENRQSGEIKSYIDLVSKRGGRTVFRSGEVNYASTDLLFHSQEEIQINKIISFQNACLKNGIDLNSLQNQLDRFSKVKILVLGDTIVDQYVACDALGMSAEAPVLAIRELETKEFIGGAAIVASHVRTIGANCHYVSVVGDDAPGKFVEKDLKKTGVSSSMIKDPTRPTTFKIRYMVNSQKMLRVSRLDDHSISRSIEDRVIKAVEDEITNLDGIIFCDFVYGVITNRVLSKIVKMAEKYNVRLFGDLQCSSQVGNVCRFKNFDLITPTEREARIAISDHESGIEQLANEVLSSTQSKNLLITLNSNGFIAYKNKDDSLKFRSQHFTALNSNPIDVAGAGDSLLATMAVGLSSGLSLFESSALGACAAAVAVGRLGNLPIEQVELKKYLNQLNLQIKSLSS